MKIIITTKESPNYNKARRTLEIEGFELVKDSTLIGTSCIECDLRKDNLCAKHGILELCSHITPYGYHYVLNEKEE